MPLGRRDVLFALRPGGARRRGADGLMIEAHPDPDHALSTASSRSASPSSAALVAGLGSGDPRPEAILEPSEVERWCPGVMRVRCRTEALEGRPEDGLFAEQRRRVDDFDFGRTPAVVFDDMLDRSVPFLPGDPAHGRRARRRLCRLTARRSTTFGCSTGRHDRADRPRTAARADVRYVGIDFLARDAGAGGEEARRERGSRAAANCATATSTRASRSRTPRSCCSVLTCSSSGRSTRERIIRRSTRDSSRTGCLILVEKCSGENSAFNRLFHQSLLRDEAAATATATSRSRKKREALENVLVPYRFEENKELLRGQGFRHVDTFFQVVQLLRHGSR
jgi:tRNA (cmo5U34)-methyltransferase